MENTNRKRITLLQIIIFNSVVLLILIIILIVNIIPNISLYEEEKKNLNTTYKELTLIKERGIDYEQFVNVMAKNPIKDAYLEALIKTISKDFYDKNILNTQKQGLFDDFIKSKELYLEKKTKERDVSERQKSVQTIFPEYTGNSLIKNEQALTDFKFINYIESILYTFNLVSIDSIGVSDVLVVDDYISQDSKKMEQGVNPRLYYIPLHLKIVWRKTDIVDFLHFAENVWAISIENGHFTVFNDKKLSQKLGEEESTDYNIYNNQVFDIENIRMQEYIDSDAINIRNEEQSIEDFIKSTQGNEKFNFEIAMRFYVKWMPDYQIKNFIKTTLEKYNDLKKESNILLVKMNKLKADSSTDIITINRLRSVDFDLKVMETEIKNLRNLYTKSASDIEPAYKEAMRINSIFETLESILQKNKKIIENLEANKK